MNGRAQECLGKIPSAPGWLCRFAVVPSFPDALTGPQGTLLRMLVKESCAAAATECLQHNVNPTSLPRPAVCSLVIGTHRRAPYHACIRRSAAAAVRPQGRTGRPAHTAHRRLGQSGGGRGGGGGSGGGRGGGREEGRQGRGRRPGGGGEPCAQRHCGGRVWERGQGDGDGQQQGEGAWGRAGRGRRVCGLGRLLVLALAARARQCGIIAR